MNHEATSPTLGRLTGCLKALSVARVLSLGDEDEEEDGGVNDDDSDGDNGDDGDDNCFEV
jgi:hypothetical protein